MVAGMICGGLWTALAGGLYFFRGVNETISSLLLNYVAIALLNHLLARSTIGEQAIHGLHDVPASAIIGSDGQIKACIVLRCRFGLTDQGLFRQIQR